MNLVLLGMPGSGKGTQAERLAARIQVPHISTGDLFREAVRQKTELGLKASAYMDRGELVPDGIVTDMVEERLKAGDAAGGFLLDGYPRNMGQADALDAKLQEMDRPLQHVLYLEVPAEEVVRRLSSRRVCSSCGRLQPAGSDGAQGGGRCACGGDLVQREDDREEVVRERLEVYEKHTRPLLDRYQGQGILLRVEGAGTPDEVFEGVLDALQLGEATS